MLKPNFGIYNQGDADVYEKQAIQEVNSASKQISLWFSLAFFHFHSLFALYLYCQA